MLTWAIAWASVRTKTPEVMLLCILSLWVDAAIFRLIISALPQ